MMSKSTPGSTTGGGLTATSVPSFTPKQTACSTINASAIQPKVKQEDCASLSLKAYDTHHASAVETLTTKFDLVTATGNEDNDKKLSSTYTINMTLQQFRRRIKLFGMLRVFILI